MHNTERYDNLEYVRKIIRLGGNTDMAEYQARYIEKSTARTIDEAIAKLHLERFATKEDLLCLEKDLRAEIHRVEKDLTNEIHRLDTAIKDLKHYLENKINRHTIYIIITIVIFNMPTPMKNLIIHVLHM